METSTKKREQTSIKIVVKRVSNQKETKRNSGNRK
jgi:hypothetical protein